MSTNTEFDGQNLIVTRTYNAPRELVFEAWFETSKVQKWWGCAECTNVRSDVERKVGGKYNHHMTIATPNGEFEQPQLATLTEYDPPKRLAYTSPEAPDMSVSVDFTEVAGGTLVRLVHANIPDMIVEGDVPLREIIRGGWTAAFGKLDVVMEAD